MKYEEPKIEILFLQNECIIRTSNTLGDGESFDGNNSGNDYDISDENNWS